MNKLLLSTTLCMTLLFPSDFSISGIQTGVSEIDNAIGQVNDAIGSLGNFDLQGILDSVDADNELLGCLTQNIDLSNIVGKIPSIDGVCGMLNTDISLTGILDNPIAKCAGVNISVPKDIQSMQDRISAFCTGNSTGSGDNNSGGWNSTTGNNNSNRGGKVYSPVGTIASDIESGSVSGGVQTSGSNKNLEDKKYPSGISVKDVYGGDGGGSLYRQLSENPDGADAKAIKTNNKNALMLKEMALKLNGTTNENDIHLPKDKLAVIQDENDVANLISLGKVDYYELENSLIQKASEKFKTLDANSLNEYYLKEKQAYQKMISQDNEVKSMIAMLKETAMRSIGNYYNMKLEQMKKREDYLPNTSYTLEKITKTEYKDEFKIKALLQMNDETLIKSDMAMKKREVNIKIDKTIQEAYYKASIFRADIAKKEIDAILKAVDTAIK